MGVSFLENKAELQLVETAILIGQFQYSPSQRFPKRKRGKRGGKGRLGERGRKEEETSAIKPFQDGRRQGVGVNFPTT